MQSEAYKQYCCTPLGVLELLSDGEAITNICVCKAQAQSCPDRLTRQAAAQLEEYFSGQRQHFTVPLKPKGTAFQQAVWAALREIPFGSTVAYGGLAAQLGRPSACRAVGTAVGRNPILIMIPCHRVLASNGIGGFAAGIANKRILLAQEGIFLHKKGNHI